VKALTAKIKVILTGKKSKQYVSGLVKRPPELVGTRQQHLDHPSDSRCLGCLGYILAASIPASAGNTGMARRWMKPADELQHLEC